MKKDLVLNKEEIEQICKKISKEIYEAIKDDDKPALIVGVLKGAVPFMMDIVKNIEIPVFVDFIQIKSYNGTQSSGKVQLLKDVSFDCGGRTVVLVEDIIDTGYSMSFLINHIMSHNPKKVYVCTLFDKKEARKVPVQIDFVGKELEGKHFLLGYGLDYNELCRNYPYVYNATKEDIEELDSLLSI